MPPKLPPVAPTHDEIEDAMRRYEARAPKHVGPAHDRRELDMKNARAMGILDGLPPDAPDDRTIALHASGRISTREYLKLALMISHARSRLH